MLVVRVEIWPGGNPERAQLLGTAAIANVSALAAESDYAVALLDENGDLASLRQVRGHRRDAGFWPLVARAVRPSRAKVPAWLHDLAEHMERRVNDFDANREVRRAVRTHSERRAG